MKLNKTLLLMLFATALAMNYHNRYDSDDYAFGQNRNRYESQDYDEDPEQMCIDTCVDRKMQEGLDDQKAEAEVKMEQERKEKEEQRKEKVKENTKKFNESNPPKQSKRSNSFDSKHSPKDAHQTKKDLLIAGDVVKIVGLQSITGKKFNGKIGKLDRKDPESGKWIVKFTNASLDVSLRGDGEYKELKLKNENLKLTMLEKTETRGDLLKKGDLVEIFGETTDDRNQLNEQQGVLEKKVTANGRWVVQLIDGAMESVLVKPANLEFKGLPGKDILKKIEPVMKARLEAEKIREEENARIEKQCPICHQDMNDDTSTTTTCGHTFHTQCIDENRRINNDICPICRQHAHGQPNVVNEEENDNNRRRLAPQKLSITKSQKLKFTLECKKECRGMKARIGRSVKEKLGNKFEEAVDRTLDGAELYTGQVLGAVYEKAKKSFVAGTHFAQQSRPYGLIFQNASSPAEGQTFTMEYIEFDALTGMEFEYKNWSKYRKSREKTDTEEAAGHDGDDENEDESENEDENKDEEKIEPGETAVVKFTNARFLNGVSGTVKINIPELNKQLHVYIENPQMGSYKCCMEFVEHDQQMNTSNCNDDNSQNIEFGKMLIHKEAIWESFDIQGETEKSRMCRVALLPKNAEQLPPIPKFY